MKCRYYLLAGAFRRWKTSTKSIAAEQVDSWNIYVVKVSILFVLDRFVFLAVAQLMLFGHKFVIYSIEMGRMSEYDIRPKPKVWAGSPNECRTFGRMLCVRMKQRLLLVSALSSQKM